MNVDAIRQEVFFEAVAEGLRSDGLSASAADTGGGIMCIILPRAEDEEIVWGTAGLTWGAAIHDAEGDCVSAIETYCPSGSEDISRIVRTLKEASLRHGAAAT